ncbi:hypothetical protein [Agrobacterium sp. FDAARGOS_525]|uniref:hypothetical protein n=1 Tax=Agrobacterium sp. FDAARGOS_525 TaxID=2420311 RepID=UPI000F66B241|nr:hypothetical protein [Agrobacterium sp. FDAARGOS_525]
MVAIVVFLFLSGRTIATSMGVVRPGTLGPHPKGWNEVEGGRRRLFCFAMQSRTGVPHAACRMGWLGGGKKQATDVAGDERGEAGLRSDPCQSRSRMERPFQEIGEYGNGGRPCASTLENGNGVGSSGRSTAALIFIVMARPRLSGGDAEPVAPVLTPSLC